MCCLQEGARETQARETDAATHTHQLKDEELLKWNGKRRVAVVDVLSNEALSLSLSLPLPPS